MNQDIEHFGISLRRARQSRALTLGEISSSTKVPRSALELIEEGKLDGLPADVFVRGFIRSYARAVGVSELQPLAQFDKALRARSEAERAESALPVIDPTIAGIATTAHGQSGQFGQLGLEEAEEAASSRRGLGLAVFVIVLLLIATITLSLLLRHPPPSGEGLSVRTPAGSIEQASEARLRRA
jgi:cytoskeletal protein RodZ